MEKFGLDVKVAGKDLECYLADMIERNDAQQIEIERGKLTIAVVKQMNNRSRLLLDACKYELKKKEFEVKNGNQ